MEKKGHLHSRNSSTTSVESGNVKSHSRNSSSGDSISRHHTGVRTKYDEARADNEAVINELLVSLGIVEVANEDNGKGNTLLLPVSEGSNADQGISEDPLINQTS